MPIKPELRIDTSGGGSGQGNGINALIEQLGNEAIDAPANTIYRFEDAYNAGEATLLWFRNGMLQDITAGDYAETDDRTVTMALAQVAVDRLLGIAMGINVGFGGLVVVDRPPAGAGAGPYTTTANFPAGTNLMVFLNGALQVQGALNDYLITLPNQFTFNLAPMPGSTVVAAIIASGISGLQARETFVGQGPFPGNVVLAGAINREDEEVLVFLNGQLQAENFDYIIPNVNTIQITRVVPGVLNRVEVFRVTKSNPGKWRA